MTLESADEVSAPGTPVRGTVFISSIDIGTWVSGPADAKPVDGGREQRHIIYLRKHSQVLLALNTDHGIGKEPDIRIEGEPASASDAPSPAKAGTGATLEDSDDETDGKTFGPGASNGIGGWDQFAANEELFGVKTSFDEEAYTTKLDRSGPDFKERERKAQQIANEILDASLVTPFIMCSDFPADSDRQRPRSRRTHHGQSR